MNGEYTLKAVDDIIDQYMERGGEMHVIEEGCLGHGHTILYDYSNKLKTIIIKERYLNEWSSTHTVRLYKKMPKKYEDILSCV